MTKAHHILLPICLIVGLAACKKDQAEEPGIPKDNSSEAAILVGYTDQMHVKSFNIVLNGDYNDEDTYDLDLNDDGIADIRFISVVVGSPGIGEHPTSFVECLHPDASLTYLENMDTTYSSTQMDYLDNGNEIWAIEATHRSCSKDDPAATVVDVDDLFVAENHGAIIDNNRYFKSGVVGFVKKNGPSPFGLIFQYQSQDTMYYTTQYNTHECDVFPQDSFQYIGVRLVVDGLVKYGWVKLKISNDKMITLSESAIHY